ncbi:MAG TPA: Uma2 family endonuclease [Saprospiraceae bacterium]|nr:Uma2 family endonuclease [Saprospiraceae bacterium]
MEENTANEPVAAPYGTGYTYGDYLKFDIDEMVEIIKGKIFKMSPAPKISHQKVSGVIHALFFNFVKNKNCQVFHAPTDVVFPIPNKKKESATTVLQPDLFIICDPNKILEDCIFGAPDLIVEILSPHTRKKDLQIKYEVYEEAAVREYWIVMPEERLIEVFVLEDGRYQRIQTYTEEDVLNSVIFSDLSLSMEEVFK